MTEAKIGVFICDCGGAMKNIDFPTIKGELDAIADVASVNLSSDLCLEEGRAKMLSCIKDENIDRVVVAACAPQLKEHVLQQVLRSAALNSYLMSMADIREQCSWAHEGDVTTKACGLIKMAIGRARLLQPVEQKDLLVKQEVLLVGGGFSAMSSAIQLSRLGLHTTLLVGDSALGVRSRELEELLGLEVAPMTEAIDRDKNIEIVTSAELVGMEGTAGNFAVRIRKGGEEFVQSFGAIIFATGPRTEILPQDPGSKSSTRIVSQERLARWLRASSPQPRPRSVAFVFDSSDECSRLPTLVTLNNALAVKRSWGSEVYVFCKNVKVDSEGAEELYHQARERGVVFLKFEDSPGISIEDGLVRIEAKDVLLGQDATLTCDVVVAEEKVSPAAGTDDLRSLLNVRTDSRGFLQDDNVHLYPVASERKGIFFVGDCRGDLDAARIVADVSSAVMGAHELLARGRITVEAERVKVDPQKCRACLTCIRVCPHSAIQLVRIDSEREVAEISDLACDACGICAGICPAKAIAFQGYSDEQILAQIEVLKAS